MLPDAFSAVRKRACALIHEISCVIGDLVGLAMIAVSVDAAVCLYLYIIYIYIYLFCSFNPATWGHSP